MPSKPYPVDLPHQIADDLRMKPPSNSPHQGGSWPAALDERFECHETIAVGRMSALFRASPMGEERNVAIKVLHSHLRDNDAVCHRLRRELAATRRLNHPAIARTEELIENDDVVALVMEYVDGRNIRDLVQNAGTQSWEVTRDVIDQVLEAIAHAHDHGVLHRDLNAHHIMVSDDGDAKIVGFGLARVDELVGMTMHTRALGALEAMAPERVLGLNYDGRADIYSVGAVAWEMLAGQPPIEGSMGQAFAHATSQAALAFELTADLPDYARYVLERALARDASTRFATADQMQRALHGDYDAALWNAWSARETELCPGCELPVVDGITACIECGHEFDRLVQEPGSGKWMINVITPRDAFERDVWFEKNTERPNLSDEQHARLMSLLGSYEDTAPFADGRWEYFWPPYILVDQLSYFEADRICEKLEERNIPHRIDDKVRPGGLASLLPDGAVARGFFLLVSISIGLVAAGLANGLSAPFIATSVALLFGTTLAGLSVMAPLQKRLQADRGVQFIGEYPVMIPSDSISAMARLTDDSLLPKRTARALRSYADESLLSEVHELIVLAVAALQEGESTEGSKGVEKLVAQVLELADELDEALQTLRKSSAADLIRRLENAEDELANSDDADRCAELIDERVELLDKLRERDQLEHQVVVMRARLTHVRGALIDLRSRRSTTGTALNDEASAFDELRYFVEATDEVKELVS